MTRFALTLEYDGASYMGLQRQAHGPSIQQSVEAAASAITGETIVMHAAGRTDAGVHALAMRAHIDVHKDISAFRLLEGINAKLRPEPIALLACKIVDDDWHARFSCTGRQYVYRITNRRAPLTLEAARSWQVATPLDAEAMHDAAQILVGKHDFTTFRSAHCQAHSAVRTLESIAVARTGNIIETHVAARSFLHHQVRSIVGCLMLVGKGKWTAADLCAALEACDRHALGFNAPPDGLYFAAAEY